MTFFQKGVSRTWLIEMNFMINGEKLEESWYEIILLNPWLLKEQNIFVLCNQSGKYGTLNPSSSSLK